MSATKGYCEDLTEGKFSFPIIHAIHNSPTDGNHIEILNILKLKTDNEHLKAYVVSQMREVTGSLDHTLSTSKTMYKYALELMDGLEPENKPMRAILASLMEE